MGAIIFLHKLVKSDVKTNKKYIAKAFICKFWGEGVGKDSSPRVKDKV